MSEEARSALDLTRLSQNQSVPLALTGVRGLRQLGLQRRDEAAVL